MKKVIKPENSAPSQTIPSKSSFWIINLINQKQIKTMLDFGCGRLRNENAFSKTKCIISVLDTKEQIKRLEKNNLMNYTTYIFEEDSLPKNSFDLVVLISVLHIIPDKSTRNKVLKMAYNSLKDGGYLFVDVPTGERYYRQKCSENNRYKDGFLLQHGKSYTFYKNYHAKELDEFVFRSIPIKKISGPYFEKHICRLYKK